MGLSLPSPDGSNPFQYGDYRGAAFRAIVGHIAGAWQATHQGDASEAELAETMVRYADEVGANLENLASSKRMNILDWLFREGQGPFRQARKAIAVPGTGGATVVNLREGGAYVYVITRPVTAATVGSGPTFGQGWIQGIISYQADRLGDREARLYDELDGPLTASWVVNNYATVPGLLMPSPKAGERFDAQNRPIAEAIGFGRRVPFV